MKRYDFAYMSTSQLLEYWKQNVRGVAAEVDSYSHTQLWKEYSVAAAKAFPSEAGTRKRFQWEDHTVGIGHTIPGLLFDTTLHLFVSEIEGHLVLFWEATSMQVDYQAARDWIQDNFTKAIVHSDAMNFGNIIIALIRK